MERSNQSCIINGWLIPGYNVSYNNTSIVNIKNILEINYFADKDNPIELKRHYIIFNNNVKWYYSSNKKMEEEFNHIIEMLTFKEKGFK